MMKHFAGLKKEIIGASDLDSLYQGKIAEHLVGQELLTSQSNVLNKLNFWVRQKVDDEQDLFLRIANNDEIAFGILFRRYGPHLHSYLTGIAKSVSAAEELVQKVFLCMWLHRDRLAAVEHTKAWIFAVASNEAYDYLKRNSLEAAMVKHI